MKRVLCGILSICIAGGASAAVASDLCADVNGALYHAKSNFAHSSPAPLANAATCDVSIAQGGQRAFHCAWAYPYRDAEASALFADFKEQLSQCWPTQSAASDDIGVNHPDSYDLKVFSLPDGTVTVSLKDKGALQQTYVFVRVSGASPN